jgi:formylglycine-generating enzyme required for sulfatase activity
MSLLFLTACGGGNNGNQNTASLSIVSMSPLTATTVDKGEEVTFAVTTANPTNATLAVSSVTPTGAVCDITGNTVICATSDAAPGAYTVEVTASAGTQSDKKTATFTVELPEIELAPDVNTNQTLFADEKNTTIAFTANKTWTIDETPSWITIDSTNGGIGYNLVTVTLTQNDTGADRNATITIATENKELVVTITQKKDNADGIPREELNIDGIALHYVEIGSFMMGCSSARSTPNPERRNCTPEAEPKHEVEMTKDIYISETEVTQAQWMAVMDGVNPSAIKVFDGKTETSLPVTNVNWNDVQTFIKKLNGNKDYHDSEQFAQILAENGKVWRLPTEAEWEWAARGGVKSESCTTDLYSCGATYPYSGANDDNDVAWDFTYADNTPHPVKTKSGNELDLYDMSGNVSEWVEDVWSSYDGTGIISGARVIRGGSYSTSGFVWERAAYLQDSTAGNIGFRLVVELTPSSEEPEIEPTFFDSATTTVSGLWDSAISGIKSLWNSITK